MSGLKTKNRKPVKMFSIMLLMGLLSFGCLTVVLAKEYDVDVSSLDIPHNGTVQSAKRKFSHQKQKIKYYFNLIEEGSQTYGKASLDIGIQKKKLIGYSDAVWQRLTTTPTTKLTEKTVTFSQGSGSYRFQYSTQDGRWNVSLGRFKANSVFLYTLD